MKRQRALNHLQAQILGVIHDERAPSVNEIARHLLVNDGYVRSVMRSLERRGYVDRMYSDRSRGFGYTLTDEGEEAYTVAWPSGTDEE